MDQVFFCGMSALAFQVTGRKLCSLMLLPLKPMLRVLWHPEVSSIHCLLGYATVCAYIIMYYAFMTIHNYASDLLQLFFSPLAVRSRFLPKFCVMPQYSPEGTFLVCCCRQHLNLTSPFSPGGSVLCPTGGKISSAPESNAPPPPS